MQLYIFWGPFGFAINFYARGFKSNRFHNLNIRGRVVEGTGLIIHFHKNVAGSNPVGCNFIIYFSNLRFNRVAFPVNPLRKYNLALRTFDDCFFVIDKIFGECNKKTCSTPIPCTVLRIVKLFPSYLVLSPI